MYEILILALGAVAGICLAMLFLSTIKVGKLKAYHDQEDENGEPYLFLVLDRAVATVLNHRYVLLKVARK